MPACGLRPETLGKTPHPCLCQGDFRYQDQTLPPLPQRLCDRFKIDFGFTRPRDAIQKRDIKRTRFYLRDKISGSLLLPRCQHPS